MKPFRFAITALVALVFSVSTHSQNVKQFFISPSGNDKYDGTIGRPFATLEKARKTVRKILEKERNISITIYFRGGNYFIKKSVVFDSLDSGTPDHPVIYSAYNSELVSLQAVFPYQSNMPHR
jgi:hypothetical protein